MEQLIGDVRILFQHSARDDVASGHSTEITDLVAVPSTTVRSMCVDGEIFGNEKVEFIEEPTIQLVVEEATLSYM